MTRSDVDMSLDIQRDLERQLEAAVNQLRDAQAENSRAAIKLGASSVELAELQAKYDKDLSSSAATIALCRVCYSVAVLAEIPLTSPQNLLFLLSKESFVGSKNPKIK